MYVQFTMNAPLGEPNVDPAVPSLDTERSGGAALECDSFSMIAAASSPACEFTSIVASTPRSASEMICPPAPEISALIQTEYPSYLLACTATVPPFSDASVMIWSQVTGLFMSMPVLSTKDFRYH